jgi:hypothetical protein
MLCDFITKGKTKQIATYLSRPFGYMMILEGRGKKWIIRAMIHFILNRETSGGGAA